MNRGLTIAGAVLLALAIIIAFALSAPSDDNFEDVIMFMVVVIPLAGLVGLTGLVLLIVGLASGGGGSGQQQQQQVVVVTGARGGSYCTACGGSRGQGAFCPACGASA